MYKIITILFTSFLLFVTPVYAGSSFLYSRPIQSDNLVGYKSIVLDKPVYAHSNHLNDLRIINDQDVEVPYFLATILDASTETEKESFILSEEAQYITTQDGTDSIITIQVTNLNAFRLELNTNDIIERSYGLYGVKDESTYYLSEGEIFSPLPTNTSVKKDVEWNNNPSIDKIRLIIHNRDAKPITPKSITVKYHLNKLVFNDAGNSPLWLVYGNDTLRSPIYEGLNYKAVIKIQSITQSELGAEILNPTKTAAPRTPSKYKLLINGTFIALALLILLGVGSSLRRNK